MLLGRLDSKKANFKSAENLPSPFDNLTVLEQKFMAVGLHTVDLVALSGAVPTTLHHSYSLPAAMHHS